MTLIPAPVRRGFDAVLEPLVRALIASGVSPNAITTVGTGILIGSAAGYGFGYVRTGGALLLLSGALDMVDGKVARGGGGMSRFGAFYDSTLDRIGEAALFTGITFYFMAGGVSPRWVHWAIWTTLIGISSGLIVSYARARAEGLGFDCRVGIAQRAERILALGIPTALFGAGRDGLLLLAIVFLMALTSLITIGQRIAHIYRLSRNLQGAPVARAARPAMANILGKGSTGV
jgi:CDP-diacylglycerol--glycerol-3-phosphate 3-phosphatidyltransferase